MLQNDVEKVLITHEQIVERCKQLGAEIQKDYEALHERPILVALLKGSIPFLCELMKYIDLPVELDFMDVSSYDGTESVGEVRVLKDLDRAIKNESILIVEDIVDTGKTLDSVKNLLKYKGAKDVRVVTLLDKPDRRIKEVAPEYVGFNVPNEFVIGFGLDFNEVYRNLPYIGVLKKELYQD